VIRRLRHLDHKTDIGDGLALGDQLLSSLELADDLLRGLPGAFHGEVPAPVWPDGDSHSPWIDLGDFQERCHSWAAFQAACTKGSGPGSLTSSGG